MIAHEGTSPSPLPARPPLVGNGDCVACEKPTDTGIAVVGTGDWPVSVLMRLGWTYNDAMIVIASATGCLTTDKESGVRFATVPRERVALLIGLCAGCAARFGGFHIAPITDGKTPLYDQNDYVKRDPANREESG